MINHTHHHEQPGLEQGVCNGVQHRCRDTGFGAQPDTRGQQTQLADSGVGHQLLGVGLFQGEVPADAGGDQPDRHQETVPDRVCV